MLNTIDDVVGNNVVSMKKVSKIFVLAYTLALYGLWMALLTPVIATLALRVSEIAPANKESVLSWAMGLGAVVALLTNPIAGQLSDRTTSRFGMRRPWIAVGMVVGLLGLLIMAKGSVTLLIFGWCLTQFGLNMALAAVTALLPDQVPENVRGRVSGLLGITLPLGILSGLFIADVAGQNIFLMFMLPGFICAVFMVFLLVTLKDRVLTGEQLEPFNLGVFFKGFWISPTNAPAFTWAFVSRFMLFLGMATMLTYQVFYLLDVQGVKGDQVPSIMFMAMVMGTVANVAGSLISGWLADKLQRRKIFIIASALIFGLGLYLIGVGRNIDDFYVAVVVVNFGQGIYLAVDMALVAQVLPNKDADAAKDMGIFNLASAIPQSIAPAIAPIFLAIGHEGLKNYTALFTAAACFATIGALSILPIRGVR